jgi:hypothetical protein
LKQFSDLIGITDIKIGRYLLESTFHDEPEMTTVVKKSENGEDDSLIAENKEQTKNSQDESQKEERFDDKAC